MTRTEYKNQHAKEHYERINFTFQKGLKDTIKKAASEMNVSVNEYLSLLVLFDMVSGSSRIAKTRQGFSVEQRAMLDSWQVGKKYQDMIEDFNFTKGEGYFIRLKKGFINDVTGSRVILCEKMHDMRMTINKSHKVNV